MAGVGNLTNENWHMFEPSPIETQLATADPVRNPLAIAMLGGYQADRRSAQSQYQDQIDAMHAQQVAEFQQKTLNDQRTQTLTALKEAGASPGMSAAIRANIPGMLTGDTSQLDASAIAKAGSENVKNAGQGMGAAAQGGVRGLTALAPALLGVQLTQQDPALVEAARIKEAGANARHAAGNGAAAGPKISVAFDGSDGTPTYHYTPPKGQPLNMQTALTALGAANGVLPGRVPIAGRNSNPVTASGGGLPMAQVDTPTAVAAPAAAAAAPAAVDAFSNFQRRNPAAAADALALARQKGGFQTQIVGGKTAVMGASGQSYPLQ